MQGKVFCIFLVECCKLLIDKAREEGEEEEEEVQQVRHPIADHDARSTQSVGVRPLAFWV